MNLKKITKNSWTPSEKSPTSKKYIERVYETKEAEKEIAEFRHTPNEDKCISYDSDEEGKP